MNSSRLFTGASKFDLLGSALAPGSLNLLLKGCGDPAEWVGFPLGSLNRTNQGTEAQEMTPKSEPAIWHWANESSFDFHNFQASQNMRPMAGVLLASL